MTLPDTRPAGQSAGALIALLVGVDRYQHGIPALQNAVRDVTAIASLLKQSHGYEVQILTDEQATKVTLLAAVDALVARVKPEDRVVIYFAGHGVADDSPDATGPTGFLLLQDARRDAPDSFLPMAAVQHRLEQLACRHLLLILDCCFAGAFRWATSSRAVRRSRVPLYAERLARYLRESAWEVLTSSACDERALDVVSGRVLGNRGDSEQNSPFAAALCAGLKGGADLRIDSSPGDGVILCTELHLYLEESFKRLEEQTGARQQRPMLWSLLGRERGEYFFVVPGRNPVLPAAADLNEKNNPYRGLEPYEEAHQQLFFGRAAALQTLAQQVLERPLTVIVGASGTGKSSLVRAGLVPRLRAAGWQILPIVRPGEASQHELAGMMDSRALLGTALAALGSPAAPTPGTAPVAPPRWLLVIDQLEELVTMHWGNLEPFLRAIEQALREHPGYLHIVLTLRADFEPHFRELLLPKLGTSPRFLIAPLSRSELREIVEYPAAERALYLDPPELVDSLVDEVADTVGALPLLSFTLSEMYRLYVRSARTDRLLTATDYRALGEVSGALSKRADEIYESLSTAQRETLQRVLLRMIAPGELARRRVLRQELQFADPQEQARVDDIVARLQAARLLIGGQDSQSRAYVEPAHDKLVLGWQRLVVWLEAEKDTLPLRQRLTAAAMEWSESPKGVDLWAGDPRLPQAMALLRQQPQSLNIAEAQFITRSQRQHRAQLATLAATLLVIFCGLVIGIVKSRHDAAVISSKAAELKTRMLGGYVERGRQLLMTGKSLHAAMWLNRAYQEGADTPELRFLLARAARLVESGLITLEGHPGPVTAGALSPDGQQAATLSAVDQRVRLWNARTGALLLTIPPPEKKQRKVSYVSFSPDGRRIATSENGWITQWSAADGRQLDAPVVNTDDNPHNCAWTSSSEIACFWIRTTNGGSAIYKATATATPIIAERPTWNLRYSMINSLGTHVLGQRHQLDGEKNPIIISRLHEDDVEIPFYIDVKQLDYASVQQQVSLVTSNGQLKVFAGYAKQDGRTFYRELVLDNNLIDVRSARIYPADGRGLILAAKTDNTVALFDYKNDEIVATLDGHDDVVESLAFAPTDDRILTTGRDGRAMLWQVIHDMHDLSRYSDSYVGLPNHRLASDEQPLAFADDGKSLLLLDKGEIQSLDLRTWKVTPRQRLAGAPDYAGSLASVAGNTLLVGYRAADELGIYDLKTGNLRNRIPVPKQSQFADLIFRFSPDGQKIALATPDRVYLLASASGRIVREFEREKVFPPAGEPGTGCEKFDRDDAELAWLADGEHLAATCHGLTAVLKSDGKWTPAERLTAPGRVALACSPTAAQCILGDTTGGVYLAAAVATRLHGERQPQHQGAVLDAGFSPDGTVALTAGEDGYVQAYRVQGWQRVARLDGHVGGARQARFTPEGDFVITADSQATLRIFSARDWTLLGRFPLKWDGSSANLSIATVAAGRGLSALLVTGTSGISMLLDTHAEERAPALWDKQVGCHVPFSFSGENLVAQSPRCHPPGITTTAE